MDPVETFEHAGLTVKIFYDEEGGDNPRDWANIGTMVCWHPNYYLGDYQITNEEGRGAVREHRRANGIVKKDRFERDDFRSLAVLGRWLRMFKAHNGVVLPLSLYEHSGITMYVGGRGDYPFDSAGWDTTVVGFIYATTDRIKELCGNNDELLHDRAKLADALREEVKTYAMYLEGRIYGYVIDMLAEDEDGEMCAIEDVYPGFDGDDSCWGFVGEDYVQETAKEAAEDVRKALDKFIESEAAEREWAARQGILTLD